MYRPVKVPRGPLDEAPHGIDIGGDEAPRGIIFGGEDPRGIIGGDEDPCCIGGGQAGRPARCGGEGSPEGGGGDLGERGVGW